MSRLHLLRVAGRGGCWAPGGCWLAGSLLGNGEKRQAGQNRKTDRPSISSFFAPDCSYPATPEIKLVPQLLFHPQSKELAIGNERAEGKYNKHCCAAATVGAQPRSGGSRCRSQRPRWAPSKLYLGRADDREHSLGDSAAVVACLQQR